jgi:two-component system sensor histidine kinase GlrK
MALGLRQKLFGGYLVLISLLVAIAGFGAFTLHELMGEYKRLVETAIPTQRALYGLEEVFRLQTANERKFYVVGSPAIAELFKSQNTEWNGLIADLAKQGGTPGVRERLATLSQAHGAYVEKATGNMEAQAEGGANLPEAVAETTQPLIDAVLALMKDLDTLIRTSQERAVAETQVRADGIVGITVMLGLITVAIGLSAAWGLSTLFTRPVRRLRAATEEIALGIFDRRVPVASKDEIGDLAASFNRMAEKLAALDQVREEFVTYVSHELRTPLTSLKEANSLLLDGLAGRLTTRQRQLLGIVQEDCLKIERLINELLDLSKMEAGMMHLQPERTGFPEIVAAAVQEMNPVAQKRDIRIRVEGGHGAVVDADPGRIRQVVTNLISNAIKFSPEGSRVTVSWALEHDRMVCAVADQGPGIPDSAREAIFEKFHQLAPQALSAVRGTGLGLPISRKIVEAHGGALWVECPPGGGSVFRFSLPLSGVSPDSRHPVPAAQATV